MAEKKKAKRPSNVIIDDVEKEPTGERDFDLERKDAEVMEEEDIPPADGDKLWHHLSPRKVLAAEVDTLTRFHVLLEALKGYGVSQNFYEKLPADMQALFNDKLVANERWSPGDNI